MELLCKTCGEEIENDWDTCPNCLSPIIHIKICPNCGREVKPTWKICPACKTSTGSTVTTNHTPAKTPVTNGTANVSPTHDSMASAPVNNYIEFTIEDKIAERYIVKKKIGQGGFGRVYQVFDQLTEKTMAIKTLPYITKDSINNILLEFESRDRLNNTEHIIKAYQPQLTMYKGQNIIIYPMEIAEKSLREWLNESKNRLEDRLDEGIEIFKQACLGVESIHETGLIHLDLKPENILLITNKTGKDPQQKWIVKISDFGLARGIGMENLEILQDGIGTPAYMAPEQILAARWKDVGKEADIYSLGMILYELIDGDLPYSGSSKLIKEKKLNSQIQITPLQSKKDVAVIAMRCLEREKGRRISSVSDIIYAIDEKRRMEEELMKRRKKAEALLDEGKKLIELKRYLEARNVIKEAEIIDPSSRELQKWKGTIEEIERIKKLDEERAQRGEMIFVQGGKFNMGSNEYADERPIHTVELKSFYIEKYLITVKQYLAFCKATRRSSPVAPRWGWFEDHPIVNVTWEDANAYAKWVGKRLPTEAEWEYAARGGDKSRGYKYSGSNKIDDVAWYYNNSNSQTNPVGRKLPNELGIHDMSGNVREWCDDWYAHYPTQSQINPHGPSSGEYKLLRGGSWNLNEFGCRNTVRNSYGHKIYDDYIGFRCVQSV